MYGKYSGSVVYDPNRDKYGKKFKKEHKTKTCILQMDNDSLSGIYRWFLEKNLGIHTQPPMFGNHITIVGGNESIRVTEQYSKLMKHQSLTFRLATQRIYKAHQFWVIPVIDYTGQLVELRKQLLGYEKPINFHLTIGREYRPEEYPSFGFEPCMAYSKLTNGIEHD